MSKEEYTAKLEQILDNYAQQYYQLLRTPTVEAKDIKDRKRTEAIKAILQLNNKAVGEDEPFSLEQEAINHDFDLGARGKEAKNQLRQELRNIMGSN